MAPTEVPHIVSFSIAAEQQHVRLIELPPALLDNISEDPEVTLKLKSVGASDIGTTVLCSANQTYEVRQVQSSNLLLLTQTERVARDGAIGGIRGISQPRGSLELTLASPDADAYLTGLLPVYTCTQSNEDDNDDGDDGDDGNSRRLVKPRITIADAARAVPCSRGEFERAWAKLCAFEHGGAAWMPSASATLAAWRSLMTAALIRGVEITGEFEPDQLVRAADEDGLPADLLMSVLRCNASKEGATMRLDRDKCVTWLGRVLLRSLQTTPTPKTDLIEQWREGLPRDWQGGVTIDRLEGYYTVSGGDVIAVQGLDKPDANQAPPKKKPMNKWHERLAASRC